MEGNNRELDIEISSTSLGNTNPESGKFGAMAGLAQDIISKNEYSKTVLKNALEAKVITEKIIPSAKFGVSVLASAVDPEYIKSLMSSIDYPYLVKFNTDFLKEKINKVKEEGYLGLGLGFAVAEEYAYGILQSHSDSSQVDRTVNAAMVMDTNTVKIRTCIETVSIEDEIKKIREVNKKLRNNGKRVMWVIEPNKKIGDGTLVDFMNIYENIKNDPKNISLKFGIDLDIGGLEKEDHSEVLSLMEYMERYHACNLPVYLSLSGKVYCNASVRTHLPLGDDSEFNKALGGWFKVRQLRGKKVPGLIVETSPTENVLLDYSKFLEGFKQGFN